MAMTEERLDKLGVYFNHFNVQESLGISFDQFVRYVEIGLWAEYMESDRMPLVHKGHLKEMVL